MYSRSKLYTLTWPPSLSSYISMDSSVSKLFILTQQSYVENVLISYSIFQAKSLMSVKNVAKRLQISLTCELIYKRILPKNHMSVRNATKRLHSSRTCTNTRNRLVVKLHHWTITITTTVIRNPFLLDLKIKNFKQLCFFCIYIYIMSFSLLFSSQ